MRIFFYFFFEINFTILPDHWKYEKLPLCYCNAYGENSRMHDTYVCTVIHCLFLFFCLSLFVNAPPPTHFSLLLLNSITILLPECQYDVVGLLLPLLPLLVLRFSFLLLIVLLLALLMGVFFFLISFF